MVGKNLIFNKVDYRPEKFLKIISSIKKDIGFKKKREIVKQYGKKYDYDRMPKPLH